MKKSRKGFTLVELLIVISIIGTLTAAMSMTSGRATASAKASTIISNVEACKTAASLYLADNYAADLSATPASAFLKENSAYIPNFGKFSDGGIKYTVGTGVGYKQWSITVNFANEADAQAIGSTLGKNKGYEEIDEDSTSLTVRLYSGAVGAGDTLPDDDVEEPAAPTKVTGS